MELNKEFSNFIQSSDEDKSFDSSDAIEMPILILQLVRIYNENKNEYSVVLMPSNEIKAIISGEASLNEQMVPIVEVEKLSVFNGLYNLSITGYYTTGEVYHIKAKSISEIKKMSNHFSYDKTELDSALNQELDEIISKYCIKGIK